MDITVCNDDHTRAERKRVCCGYVDFGDGKITSEDWADEDKFPRKQWLDVEVNPQTDVASFLVVDNRSGDCFVESFDTLDGAMLYLCDIHDTCAGQAEWDYPGAVKDRGSLDIYGGPYVIKCPIALNSAGVPVFGYAKAIVPGGRTDEVFTENIDEAIMYKSRDTAKREAMRLLGETFSACYNVVSLEEERKRIKEEEKNDVLD